MIHKKLMKLALSLFDSPDLPCLLCPTGTAWWTDQRERSQMSPVAALCLLLQPDGNSCFIMDSINIS